MICLNRPKRRTTASSLSLAGSHRNIMEVGGVQGTYAELLTLSMEATTSNKMKDIKRIYAPHWLGCSAQSVNRCSRFFECNVGVRVAVDMTCKDES